tara:strand:+ start:1017 stop:1604 length:588 start_codon:yes stop_codon:yes gene_type:complete
MITDLIITDDFYQDVDSVREFALNQPFDVKGNYPGQRTKTFHEWPGLKDGIQQIVKQAGGNITWYESEYTSTFQYTTKKDTSWIHPDHTTMWAGVCYLTPNAPVSGGTGIFRHKETGLSSPPRLANGEMDDEWLAEHCWPHSRDFSKWDMTAMVGNVYNRLVLYRGDLFHSSLDYFGNNKHDGRLFQTFFFNTEY